MATPDSGGDNTGRREFRFADRDALAYALADSIANDLRRAMEVRQRASLVVSGGNTPRPLFERLASIALPWSRVWLGLADERWVATNSADSNENLVRQTLLLDQAAQAHFVGLKNAAPTPDLGQEDCATALAALPRPFDVLVLGMGDDGHTASLFPKSPQLTRAVTTGSGLDCIGVDPVTAPHARMSLTLDALLDSRRIILHLAGPSKWDVYWQATEPGPLSDLPVRAIIHQSRVPLDVYWAP
jgi:6-phosphogluconolactonase